MPAAEVLPLRIGVNALYLIPGGVGGTEIYLRGLLAALAEIDSVHRYFVFTNRETGPDLTPAAPNFQQVPQHVRAVVRPARLLWEQSVLPLQALKQKLDVLLNPGFTAPLLCSCPQVTVFHDLQHKRHPEYFRWFDLPFWRFFLYWAAHISRLVLADSQATADDLLKYYRLPAPVVKVVPLGVDPVFFDLARHRRPERFLLAVSTLHPHKNLDGLLRAFARFRRTHPEFRLVVSGMHGLFTGPLRDLRDQLGLADAVEFPGWIAREALHDLYTRAWAFVFPSKFEGFGIPLLEALAAGVPTACSAIEPLAGAAGDAALLFDPYNPEAIAEALERIASDESLRARLAAEGPRRAAQFSWKATAAATLEALITATRSA
ncbi:MAG TPA: glycosyltransferase family 1 protein [Bryobacteraceae bacterium]|nr:glycosyltransferase family 1 protein [Bryobacteraceae bacterium]